MLYERWREIARVRAGETALRDLASGRSWTFAELSLATEQAGPGVSPLAFPRGLSAEFILSVIRAWRNGQIVCPLEDGQNVPDFTAPAPSGIVHLKTTSATAGAPRL